MSSSTPGPAVRGGGADAPVPLVTENGAGSPAVSDITNSPPEPTGNNRSGANSGRGDATPSGQPRRVRLPASANQAAGSNSSGSQRTNGGSTSTTSATSRPSSSSESTATNQSSRSRCNGRGSRYNLRGNASNSRRGSSGTQGDGSSGGQNRGGNGGNGGGGRGGQNRGGNGGNGGGGRRGGGAGSGRGGGGRQGNGDGGRGRQDNPPRVEDIPGARRYGEKLVVVPGVDQIPAIPEGTQLDKTLRNFHELLTIHGFHAIYKDALNEEKAGTVTQDISEMSDNLYLYPFFLVCGHCEAFCREKPDMSDEQLCREGVCQVYNKNSKNGRITIRAETAFRHISRCNHRPYCAPCAVLEPAGKSRLNVAELVDQVISCACFV